jgi:hypothetical protein
VDFDSIAGQGTTFRLSLPPYEPPVETNGASGQGEAQTLATPGD